MDPLVHVDVLRRVLAGTCASTNTVGFATVPCRGDGRPQYLTGLNPLAFELGGVRRVAVADAAVEQVRPDASPAALGRAELFANDATRKQLTFHDLRATGITWMALRGDEPIKIMRRAGHEDIATTMGYVREAENLMHPVGEPFPPLPAALLVSSAESSEGPAHWAQLRESTYKTVASPAGFEPA
ncbi:site-specific integrase [Sorangium sp. So ce590]|uniref:site-specific integrase n=1 Tax=unclassified Sorangium TaxID=2621164 RepID=UPI003F6005FC